MQNPTGFPGQFPVESDVCPGQRLDLHGVAGGVVAAEAAATGAGKAACGEAAMYRGEVIY